MKFKYGMLVATFAYGFIQFFCLEVYEGAVLYAVFFLEIVVGALQVLFLLRSQRPEFFECKRERDYLMSLGTYPYIFTILTLPNLPLAVKACPVILTVLAGTSLWLIFRNRRNSSYYATFILCLIALIFTFTDRYWEFHS